MTAHPMSPHSLALDVLAAPSEQLPEDVGKAGPIGLLLIVLLLIAVVLLVRSMSKHLKRLPTSFDPDQPLATIPDDASGLVDPGPQSGEEILDSLRRAPRAIEPPRAADDGRPDTP